MPEKDNLYRPESTLDSDLQKELDAALGGASLDDLIEAESVPRKPRKPGPRSGIRKGTVIAIQGDDIFVDVGGRSEGLLPASQFGEDEPLPEIGAEVEVTIEGTDETEGLMRLSRQGAILAATWDTLKRGDVVEVRVTGDNKGGLEVIFNGIKGFMPASQIDFARIEDFTQFENEKLPAVVQEIDYQKESVVVSRRDYLEKQREEAKQKTWETLEEGQTVPGTVRTIMPYGAFVDIGGVDGLLHIKDMAFSRVEKPEDLVQVGQELEVRVLSVDRENQKVGLGLKQTMTDPWEDVLTKYPPEEVVSGRVVKLADFGAFVELEPGVEGLIPIGELTFGKRIGHPREILNKGDMVKIRVMNVEPDRKRISLSLKRVGDDPWTGAEARWAPETVLEGTVTRIADFGAFVELTPGVEGLIHISELDTKHVPSVESVLSEGQSVQAKVIEVDEQRRRISLSIKQLKEPAASAPAQGSMDDLNEKIQSKPSSSRKKNLKGGLDAGSTQTKFGELRLG
jgi:small subunit ribosomal protein S1